jgi:aminopeptidase N
VTAAHNLSRATAEERARMIRVLSYDIHVDLTGAGAEDTFRSTTTIRFDCTEPGSNTVVDLAAGKVIGVTLNGVRVGIEAWSSETGLPVAGLGAKNVLSVEAEFAYVTGGRGMHRCVDPADGEVYLYTSFEPAAAQRVFACFDQPDLKAEFTWHVRIPAGWRAISNMPETHQESPDSAITTVHFAPSPRMSTYITAVCVGPYAEVRSAAGGRDLGIFCRPSMLEHLDADEVFDLTRRGMDFYEERFGQPYPLPKYDHVAAPNYMGAMENFGCIVFGERYLIFRSTPSDVDRRHRGMIILHELAHMWFGDLVTMRWWDDLWLNEAFATWASYWCMAEVTELIEPWASFVIQIKNAGIKADELSSTHPVCADIPDVEATEVNFDSITYRKGASVLKQLSAYVGIDRFTSALRAYFTNHAWGNATFDDLVAALGTASGRPVKDFAAQWLQTAQVNTLRPQLMLDAAGAYEGVVVIQEAPANHPTLRSHRLRIGLYDLIGPRLARRDRIEVELDGERTEITALRGVKAADVLLLNDDDLTYAKIRLDERSLAAVLGRIHALPSALSRAICWAALADMVSGAEMAARDFVSAVCASLPAERDPGLVASVLGEATGALDFTADPAWAPRGWAMLASACRSAAHAAEPGGSMQLTWVRGFISAARTPGDLAQLAAWYAERELPEGRQLDADLRWQILQGLVAFGAAGSEDVEREAASDRTVNGEREAALARALIPTAEAKRRAWQIALDGTGLPLEVRFSSILGYGHPAHTHLTGEHVAGYLDGVDLLWREQGKEIGRLFATVAFPAAHVSAETIAAIDAWSLAGPHPQTLVRLVTEGRDRIVRALAARARDAARYAWPCGSGRS